jgi:hypothetical protein
MVMSVNQKPKDKSGGSSPREREEVANPVPSTSREPGSTRDARSDAGVEQFTPHVILDLYARLSNEDKLAFLRLVGSASTAEALVALADALPITEKSRYSQLLTGIMAETGFYQFVQREAIKVVRENCEKGTDELERILDEQLREYMPEYDAAVVEIAEAERKKKQYPAKKVKERRGVIRKLLASNPELSPRQILSYLLEHHPDLALKKKKPIQLKTILNDLAEIKTRAT